MSQCGSSWGLICYSGTTLHGLDYAHISMVVVFNGVLTGSGCLAFRPHLLIFDLKPGKLPKLFTKMVFLFSPGQFCFSPLLGEHSLIRTDSRRKQKRRLILLYRNSLLWWSTPRAWQKGELLKYSPEWDMATEPKFWIITLERTGNKWAFFVIKGINWMVGGRETANGNRHD